MTRSPPVAASAVELGKCATWVEKVDPNSGEWQQGALRSLDEYGLLPYGYVKYRAEFSLSDTSAKTHHGLAATRTISSQCRSTILLGFVSL